MSFTIASLDELHEFLVAMHKAVFPTADVSRESFNWKFLRTFAAGVADNNAHITSVKADLLPDTASGGALDRWGAILGVARKTATAARKSNALRVRGLSGASVSVGDELGHESGLRFQINEDVTLGVSGFADVDVVALDTGATTRLSAGEVLTFAATPTDIEEAAELQLAIDEDGDDAESDGAYRLRILARLSTPPLGGAQSDYEQWALEVTGIAAAYVYPNRAGLGTVDVVGLHAGSGTSRVLLEGERQELEDYINELRPVGVKGFRVLEVTPETVDVEVTVTTTGEAIYEWDWDDTTPPVVSTWNGGTRTLTFVDDRPDTMKAGDSLVIKDVAVAGTGQPYVIEELVGDDAVILEEVPAVAPLATDTVYAAGPLTDPVRDAVKAFIDGLGTANPDVTRYGAWEGSLRVSSLYRVANGVPGVIDSEVIAPAATVDADDPAFPNDASIGLLIPGRILVRRG